MLQWDGQNVTASYPRGAWGAVETHYVYVQCKTNELKGEALLSDGERAAYCRLYEKAKNEFDKDAAFDIIDRWASLEPISPLVDAVIALPHAPIVVFPESSSDGYEGDEAPKANALPFAYAHYLSDVLACGINKHIFQKRRIGRTKLGRLPRFLLQPTFAGRVERGQSYILVDDVISMGGTIASLCHYILQNGGIVVGSTCMANANGKRVKFSVTSKTLNLLRVAYSQKIDPFWTRTFGHSVTSLTEGEAQYLAVQHVNKRWKELPKGEGLLRRLREELNSEAAEL